MNLVAFAGSIGLFVASVLVVRAGEMARLRSQLVGFELRFPRQLPADALAAFLDGLNGMLPPVWKRWLIGVPFVVSEVAADHHGTQVTLLVPRPWVPTVRSLLTAHLGSVRREEVAASNRVVRWATEYRLSTSQRPLRIDPAATSSRVLASLQPLAPGERVVVQIVLAPSAPVGPVRIAPQEHRSPFPDGSVADAEAASALRTKLSTPQIEAVVRVGAQAAGELAGRRLLRRVEAALHSRAPGVQMRRRLLPSGLLAKRVSGRSIPIGSWPGGRLRVDEAAGLLGWPVEAEWVAGLELSGGRVLPASARVSHRGLVIGTSTYPGSTRRPVAIEPSALQYHALITGATGSGKSVAATNLAVSFANAGFAVIVVDPKDGSLTNAIAERLDPGVLGRTMVVDPSSERVVGFNPLQCTPETRELVADRLVATMVDIWGRTAVGARSQDLLRHTLLLAATAGLRLTEAPLLLTDANLRARARRLVGPDPPLLEWLDWFDHGISDAERNAMVAAPLNKLRHMAGRGAVRALVGQDDPALDFTEALNGGRVVLVSVPEGTLGPDNAALVSASVITQVWSAIAARAAIAPDRRRPALVVVDELATVLRHDAGSIESFVTQARAYRVGLITCTQTLDMVPTPLARVLLANCRTKVVLAPGRSDAQTMAREFGNSLTADDLMALDPYEAVAAIYADGRTQPPCTVRLSAPSPPLRPAAEVLERSAQQYGQDRAEIEAAIARRTRPGPGSSVPIGRKPRST